METIVSFTAEIRQIIYALISVGSGFLGAWWGFAGMWNWYESANGRSDISMVSIATDLFVASIALSITYYFASFAGESFSETSSGVYPQFAASLGQATTTANTTMAALFSLLAMMGFLGKTKALILARDVGRGKSDAGPLRVVGYLIISAILGDMGTAITKLDQSIKSGIFN